VTLVSWFDHIPVLIYLPDIEPGLAIRFLSRFAAKVAVTSQESYQYLPRKKVVVTGYPVRSELSAVDRLGARQALDLDLDDNTLLVFGGSRGSRSINQALVAGLQELLPTCQIIHVSGRLDSEWVAAAAEDLPTTLKSRYHHYGYLHEMPTALVAADLAVTRAGAATLGEFPAAGLAAILVPYPFAGQHQDANAHYMERNGAARTLRDAELGQKLVPTVVELLNDHKTLVRMREAAKAMARPDAAEAIAGQLWLIARQHPVSGAGAEP
jgi:UDP-N-acetylglucosamine--N-acetylmuramyl-(pentapeptide) pyrophosphoryl-undecaprenol N-acetylglucosamine transferase